MLSTLTKADVALTLCQPGHRATPPGGLQQAPAILPGKNARLSTMKRNWDQIRKILQEAEASDAGVALVYKRASYWTKGQSLILEPHRVIAMEDDDFLQAREHIFLLSDGGLVEIDEGRCINFICLRRLTSSGHDFLEGARDEGRWHRALSIVREKGGAVTLGVLTQILSSLLKQALDIH
ncbi:MAG: DUF2513 domain-containing protein [Synechococcaceae cyanobacterium]